MWFLLLLVFALDTSQASAVATYQYAPTPQVIQAARINVWNSSSAFQVFFTNGFQGNDKTLVFCDNNFDHMQLKAVDKHAGTLTGASPWVNEKTYYVIDPAMGVSSSGQNVAVFPSSPQKLAAYSVQPENIKQMWEVDLSFSLDDETYAFFRISPTLVFLRAKTVVAYHLQNGAQAYELKLGAPYLDLLGGDGREYFICVSTVDSDKYRRITVHHTTTGVPVGGSFVVSVGVGLTRAPRSLPDHWFATTYAISDIMSLQAFKLNTKARASESPVSLLWNSSEIYGYINRFGLSCGGSVCVLTGDQMQMKSPPASAGGRLPSTASASAGAETNRSAIAFDMTSGSILWYISVAELQCPTGTHANSVSSTVSEATSTLIQYSCSNTSYTYLSFRVNSRTGARIDVGDDGALADPGRVRWVDEQGKYAIFDGDGTGTNFQAWEYSL